MAAKTPSFFRLPTTKARNRLSEILTRVQDPRSFCVLTRHGKPVAATVSMHELDRIHDLQNIEDVSKRGMRPVKFRLGKHFAMTNAEAAEGVLKAQMDRRTEREVLKHAGLEPVPGGEVVVEVDVPMRRRWWWPWGRKGN